MKRFLFVLAALAAVGIAVLWRASVTTQSIGAAAVSERLEPEEPAQRVALPLPPVERAANAPAAPIAEAETPVEAAPRTEERATGVLELVVVARETRAPLADVSVKLSSRGSDAGAERWSEPERETDAGGSIAAEVPAGMRLVATIQVGEAQPLVEHFDPLAPGERRRVEVEVMTDETLLAVVRVLAAEDDAPIAGARVALRVTGRGSSFEELTTTSDGEASFELDAAVPCHALVDAEGYATRRVQVADGRSAGESSFVVRLRRSAELTVRVLDERGAGLAGLAVRLSASGHWIQEPGSMLFVDTSDIGSEVGTAADGSCTFDALPPEVPFSLEIARNGRLVRREAKPVTLEPGESRALEIRLGSSVAIRGRLLDQHGTPVPAHAVWLVSAGEGAPKPFLDFADATAMTTTDGEGSFDFRDVAPGRWWLGPGGRDDAFDEFDPSAVSGVPEVVELAPGDADREVVLRAHRGLSIAGRVVDPNGEPVKNVLVFIDAVSDSPDASGAFEIGPLVPGSHGVWVHPLNSGWAAPPSTKVEAGSKDVVIELVHAGSLLCVVRDASGQHASASIVLARGEEYLTIGDATGGSTEFKGLTPGTYSLVASSSDGCALAPPVVIEAGRATEIELVLAPAARLAVRYTGKSAHAQLRVWSGNAVVAADGIATGTSLECNVPAGALRVSMKSDGGTQDRMIDARAGELVELAFE